MGRIFLIGIIDLNELLPESQYKALPEVADCRDGKCSVVLNNLRGCESLLISRGWQ